MDSPCPPVSLAIVKVSFNSDSKTEPKKTEGYEETPAGSGKWCKKYKEVHIGIVCYCKSDKCNDNVDPAAAVTTKPDNTKPNNTKKPDNTDVDPAVATNVTTVTTNVTTGTTNVTTDVDPATQGHSLTCWHCDETVIERYQTIIHCFTWQVNTTKCEAKTEKTCPADKQWCTVQFVNDTAHKMDCAGKILVYNIDIHDISAECTNGVQGNFVLSWSLTLYV